MYMLFACIRRDNIQTFLEKPSAAYEQLSPFWGLHFSSTNDVTCARSHPRRCYSGSTTPYRHCCAQRRSACHATWSGDVAQPASTSSRTFQRRESVPLVSSLEPLGAAHHQKCTAATSSNLERGRHRNGTDSTNGSHPRLAAAVFPNS